MWDSDERECVLEFDQKSAPIPDEKLAPVVEAVTGICRNLFKRWGSSTVKPRDPL